MNRLLPELFLEIIEHLPIIFRPPTCLSLALTSRRLCDILIPSVLYRYVKYESEEIALENLKRLTDEMKQRNDQPLAHYIHDFCIQSNLRLPLSDFNCVSFGWLKQLVELDGLRNLEALSIKLSAVPERRPEEFEFAGLWNSINIHCPGLKKVDFKGIPQLHAGKDWVFSQIISSRTLRWVSIDIILFRTYVTEASFELPPFSKDLTGLKFNIECHDSLCTKVLKYMFSGVYPNLRTLALLHSPSDIPMEQKTFWKVHSKIERLEMEETVGGEHWFKDFEDGMLPELKYLKAGIMARVDLLVPHVYQQLVSLIIPTSYNAQALYLLRGVTDGKPFLRLRYLGIHLVPRLYDLPEGGSHWREIDDGEISPEQVDPEESPPPHVRFFDRSYITSIARAAPYLTALELIGPSRGSFSELAESLAQLSCLRHIILSGPIYQPFFTFSTKWEEYSKWKPAAPAAEWNSGDAPANFNETVERLAEKLPSLEKVTIGFQLRDLSIVEGMLSAKVVRDSKGDIVDVVKIKARGETLGREEDWY